MILFRETTFCQQIRWTIFSVSDMGRKRYSESTFFLKNNLFVETKNIVAKKNSATPRSEKRNCSENNPSPSYLIESKMYSKLIIDQ